MKTNKLTLPISAIILASCSLLNAETSLIDDIKKNSVVNELTPEEVLRNHSKGSLLAAKDQDKLSGDVQGLLEEQTGDEVIQLLGETKLLMEEATELLENKVSDGNTIAVETEILQKILDVAVAKGQ